MPTEPLAEDAAGHDPDLAFARRQHARAIGPDQPRLRARQRPLHPHHVEHRNALGDRDDQRHLGVDRLEDRIGGEGRRHVDHAGVGAGRRDRLGDRVEDGQADMGRAAFAGRHPADHLRPVGERLLGVEGAGFAGHPLGDDLGVGVYEDAHAGPSCVPRRRPGSSPKQRTARKRRLGPGFRRGTVSSASCRSPCTPPAAPSPRRPRPGNWPWPRRSTRSRRSSRRRRRRSRRGRRHRGR